MPAPIPRSPRNGRTNAQASGAAEAGKIPAKQSVKADHAEALPNSPLARLRLLVALDALLRHGSVSEAGRELGLSTPAMSRTLAQIRALYDDEILTRSGRSMLPTPFAQQMRDSVGALAQEAERLVQGGKAEDAQERSDSPQASRVTLAVPSLEPPKRERRDAVPEDLDGAPSSEAIRARHRLAPAPTPRLRLAQHIAAVAAPRGLAQSLTAGEAEDAFAIVLRGEADHAQSGALLAVWHHRGVTGAELEGMLAAARATLPKRRTGGVDLDWPAYLSPRYQRPPWYLLAAKLLAQNPDAPLRILLHGHARRGAGCIRSQVLAGLGITEARDLQAARALIARKGIAFIALPDLHAGLQEALDLYPYLGGRTPATMVPPLLNPLKAPAILSGVLASDARLIHKELSAEALGARLLTLDSHRDVAQATPHRLMSYHLRDGASSGDYVIPQSHRRPSARPAGYSAREECLDLWTGRQRDPAAVSIVIDTAALALVAVQGRAGEEIDFEAARAQALALWEARDRSLGGE